MTGKNEHEHTRQLRPGLSHNRIIPIGKAIDKPVSKRLPTGRGDELALLRLAFVLEIGPHKAVRHVVENGVVEQEGILLHEADLRPPPREIDVVQLAAAGRDAATELDRRLARVFLWFRLLYLSTVLPFRSGVALSRLRLHPRDGTLIAQAVPPHQQPDNGRLARA